MNKRRAIPLLLIPLLMIPAVWGMGAIPSSCPNRYYSSINAMNVTWPQGVLEPLTTPNANVTIPISEYVNVTMTLQTSAGSISGNSANGTTWYSEDTGGFQNGHCAPISSGGKTVTVTFNLVRPLVNLTGSQTYYYTYRFSTYVTETDIQTVLFNVNWVTTTNSSTSTTSSSSSTTHTTPDFSGYFLPLALVASLSVGVVLTSRRRR